MSQPSTARTTTTSPRAASKAWRGPCVPRSQLIRSCLSRCLQPRGASAAEIRREVEVRTMAVFTVHLPRRLDDPAAVERVKFVREGFSWAAFFFGPLWLLFHRLWLTFLLWVVAAVALAA